MSEGQLSKRTIFKGVYMLAKTKIVGLMLATGVVFTSAMLGWADNWNVKSTSGEDSSHQVGDWHHGHGDQMMAKILNLSEDQEKQLKDSLKNQKDVMKSIFEQMKSNREE